MAISLKEFKEHNPSSFGEKSKSLAIFLKKNKKAYTSKELSVELYGEYNKKNIGKTNALLTNLKKKGIILHKSPYYAYNFRRDRR